VATKPVDFRRGADSLAALAKDELQRDPFSGTIRSDRLLQSDPILGRNAQIAVTADRRMACGTPVGRERSAPRQAPPPKSAGVPPRRHRD
jgi:hypothetical protein